MPGTGFPPHVVLRVIRLELPSLKASCVSLAMMTVRSLPRLRGRAGERVSPQRDTPQRRKPSPAPLCERGDLSRKREK